MPKIRQFLAKGIYVRLRFRFYDEQLGRGLRRYVLDVFPVPSLSQDTGDASEEEGSQDADHAFRDGTCEKENSVAARNPQVLEKTGEAGRAGGEPRVRQRLLLAPSPIPSEGGLLARTCQCRFGQVKGTLEIDPQIRRDRFPEVVVHEESDAKTEQGRQSRPSRSAGRGNRTPMELPPSVFETDASASSAIPANGMTITYNTILFNNEPRDRRRCGLALYLRTQATCRAGGRCGSFATPRAA